MQKKQNLMFKLRRVTTKLKKYMLKKYNLIPNHSQIGEKVPHGGHGERQDELKRLEVETIEDTDKKEEKGRKNTRHKGLTRKSCAEEE